MTKSLRLVLILSTCFVASCASHDFENSYDAEAAYAADDCKSLTGLFKDQNLNASASVIDFQNNSATEKSKDKITWPWKKGGTNEDKLSKERAAMRKAHRRKGCAQ